MKGSGNSFFEHPAGFKFVDNISSMAQHDLSVIIQQTRKKVKSEKCGI